MWMYVFLIDHSPQGLLESQREGSSSLKKLGCFPLTKKCPKILVDVRMEHLIGDPIDKLLLFLTIPLEPRLKQLYLTLLLFCI